MGNNTTDSKLDETVKDTLSNYEAKYDAGDWSRMERMLNAAPKSSNFSWNYKLSTVIGIVVIAGGYLIYNVSHSSRATADKIIEAPVNSPKTIEKTVPAPVITTNTVPVKETPAQNIPPPQNTSISEQPVINSKPTNETTTTDKNDIASIKKDKKKKEDDSSITKNQRVSVMGNEPIFGDMIDSSKGIIHETKEKESTKKAAKSKGTSNIGLSGLLHINADSIRKQSEQMKKDSLKDK